MNSLMKEYGMVHPEYEETGGNFVVIFKRKYEPVTEQVTKQVPSKYQASTMQVKILNFCKEPRSRDEIQKCVNLKHREYFRSGILNPLIKAGSIAMTVPDKPKSSKQKYITTKKGRSKRPKRFDQ